METPMHPRTLAASMLLVGLAVGGCGGSEATGPTIGLTIDGRLLSTDGTAVPGYTVLIGSHNATTDTAGRFSIAGVTAPYDVTVIPAVPAEDFIGVYQGLSRTDPVLPFLGYGVASHAASALVTAFVSGGDPTALAGDTFGLA